MKRSTWIAVLGTVVVLLVAGNAPRLPWAGVLAAGRDALAHVPHAWGSAAGRPAPAPLRARTRTIVVPPGPAPTVRVAGPAGARPRPTLLATPRHAARPPGFVPPLQVVLPVVAGLLAGLLAAIVLVLRRDARGSVFRMARRGMPAERIARSARVPQDAVRTLLTPGLGARR